MRLLPDIGGIDDKVRMPRPPASISTSRGAGDAVQLALVARLDAVLADEVAAFVVAPHAVRFEPFEILVADSADVSEDVRGDLAHRILAEEARLDLHAGEAVGVGGKPRDLFVAQARPDRQAFGSLYLVAQFAKAVAVARLDLDHRRELVDRRLDVRHPTRSDLERIRRIVACEHYAVAIHDQARDSVRAAQPRFDCPRLACGNNRGARAADRMNRVSKQRERHEDHRARHRQSHLRPAELAIEVAELHAHGFIDPGPS